MRICAPRALPLADSRDTTAFGGRETRAWVIAQGLSQRSGLKVILDVEHQWRAGEFSRENVTVCIHRRFLKRLRQSLDGRVRVLEQFPGLSVQRWDLALLWQLPILCLARLFRPFEKPPERQVTSYSPKECDVLIVLGVNQDAVEALRGAKQLGSRTILSIASNGDLHPRFATEPEFRNEYGERGDVAQELIQQADVILCQTPWQAEQLRTLFHKDSDVLGNPIDLRDWDRSLTSAAPSDLTLPNEPYLLWIGRADRHHKRPLEFLRAVSECLHIPVVMVMNPGEHAVADEVRTGLPRNVQLIDRVPFDHMPALFRGARLFVSTGASEHEGLPNVLLQAAASQKPILSLDYLPECFLSSGAGVVAGTVDHLSQEMTRLWQDETSREPMGLAGRMLVEREFALESYLDRLVAHFEKNPNDEAARPKSESC